MIISTGLGLGFIGGILCDIVGDSWKIATSDLYNLPPAELRWRGPGMLLKKLEPLTRFFMSALATVFFLVMVVKFAINSPSDGVNTFWGYIIGGIVGRVVTAIANVRQAKLHKKEAADGP